jgi:CRP-like cAMP-binding protein
MPLSDTDTALIQASPLLQDIPHEVLCEAIDKHPENHFLLPPNQVIVESGTKNPGLFIIAHGIVELFIQKPDGKDKTIDFVKNGCTFAEEALFNEHPLQYSARSLTQAAALRLPGELVSDWIDAYPEFARRLISMVAQRIGFLYKDVLTLCTKRATARLVCYIVCHFDHAPKTTDGSYSLHLPIPRNKLASRLNITASHLSRSFGELQEKGLIVQHGNGYFIPDVPSLSRYVCPKGCDFDAP